MTRTLAALALILSLGPLPSGPLAIGSGAAPFGVLGVAHAAPADLAVAELEQQTLPGLTARAQTAQARILAAEAWFDGQGSSEQAFPQLPDNRRNDQVALALRLQTLDAAAQTRASERVAPAIEGLSTRQLKAWREALRQALEAEDQADALERRYLWGIQAALALAPELEASAVNAQLVPWQELRARASQPLLDDDPATQPTPEALEQARQADLAEASLLSLVDAALTDATVPGSALLQGLVSAELSAAAPEGPFASHAQADRLRRVQPLLSGAPLEQLKVRLQESERAALQSEVDQLKDDLTQPPIPPLALNLEQHLLQLSALQEAAPAPLEDGLDALRSTLHGLQVERARALTLALEERDRLAEEAQAQEAQAADRAGATEGLAAEARVKADEASRRAGETTPGDGANQLRAQLAGVREHLAELLEQESVRSNASLLELRAARQTLEERVTAGAAARSLPPLAPNRRAQLDLVYQDLRDSVTTLSETALRSGKHLRDVRTANREERSQLGGDVHQGLGSSLAQDWRDAELELNQALDARHGNAMAELDVALKLLDSARTERRRVRDGASSDARANARTSFVLELVHELKALPLQLSVMGRDRLSALQHLPGMLTDLPAVGAFLLGSFEVFLLAVAWSFAIRRIHGWVRIGLHNVSQGDNVFEARELNALAQPLGDVARVLLDLITATLLFALVNDRMPLVSLVFLVLVARAAYTVAPMLVRLALARPDERRLALRTTSGEALDFIANGVRLALWWLLVRVGLVEISLDLLNLDRVTDLIYAATSLGLIGSGMLLLSTGSQVVRGAVLARQERNAVTDWVTRPESSPVVRMAQSAVGLGWLTLQGASALATQIAERRAGLGWLAALMARRQVNLDRSAAPPPLPRAVLHKVLTGAEQPPHRLKVEQQLEENFKEWTESRRRGMVALVGDWGSGKTPVVDAMEGRVTLPVVRVNVPEGLYTPGASLSWFNELLELPPAADGAPPSVAQLVDALATRTPSVFVVDDLHQIFLRKVGGYSSLADFIALMQASSHRHFWICTFHEPTWNMLDRLSVHMGLHAFRAVVRLSPLEPEALAGWLEGRAHEAGITPIYDDIVRDRRLGGNRELALARARSAYWRLLSEASEGNPTIALQLWVSSLRACDTPQSARVAIFESPPAADLESLPDTDLFVLAAFVVHDGLDTQRLQGVLNFSEGRVRGAVERLLGMGVLRYQSAGRAFELVTRWRPTVRRVLIQKHFLRRT